jgi:hypothetical protein
MSPTNLSLDFHTFVRTAAILAFLFALFNGRRGIILMRNRDSHPYFRVRQQQLTKSWRHLFTSGLLILIGIWLFFSGEQAIYRVFKVTRTPSPTLTQTLSPSPSFIPTLTLTPSTTATLQFTYTPSPSPIPILPNSIIALFESSVTPSADTVFSPITFSTGLNLETYNTVGAGTSFENPVNQIFATFSYDQMIAGVQWTALWYRQGELVHFEILAWDGGTGGLGFTDWAPNAEEWLPGSYQVQIFVGEQSVVIGDFQVVGEALSSTPTSSATPSSTVTFTQTNTPTITATHTRFPTYTSAP